MKAKYLYIIFILITAQNILAQTTVVISNGTGIYVPLGSSFCADTIKVLEGGYYITADTSGTCPGATITGDGFISLPVELTSFTASVSGSAVTLNWATATETNNNGFEVQRKLENTAWERIGFIEGHGTTTEIQNYQFIDNISDIQATSLSYRLKQMDYDGSYEYSDVVEVTNPAPTEFALHQNYPNPFNPSTTIKYGIPDAGPVTIRVYDVLGNEVALLVNERMEAGRYEVTLDASALSSGVYIYHMRVNDFIDTKKMLLLK